MASRNITFGETIGGKLFVLSILEIRQLVQDKGNYRDVRGKSKLAPLLGYWENVSYVFTTLRKPGYSVFFFLVRYNSSFGGKLLSTAVVKIRGRPHVLGITMLLSHFSRGFHAPCLKKKNDRGTGKM